MTIVLTKKQQKEVNAEVQRQVHHRILGKSIVFSSKFKEQTATALIAAFSLLIALGWKDVATKLVEVFAKSSWITRVPYINVLITAIIVTVISIIGIAIVSRWAKNESQHASRNF